jgi:aminopeptidase B
VPYEKGFAFVSYLRQCVGSDEAMDGWLTAYFSRFAFRSIDAVDMLESFFDACPHFRGDWTREGWLQEEREGASQYWTQGVPAPSAEKVEESAILPALPSDPAQIVGANGKRGLAYRPGYEFLRWFHQPGWPVYFPSTQASLSITQPAEELAQAWIAAFASAGAKATPALASESEAHRLSSWHSYGRMHFLDTLLAAAEKDREAQPASADGAQGAVSHALLSSLDAQYGFGTSTNSELRLRWSQLTAVTVFEPGMASVGAFLTSTGKLKYVTPVYRALVNARPTVDGRNVSRDFARVTYKVCRETYHAATQSRVDGVFAKAGLEVE